MFSSLSVGMTRMYIFYLLIRRIGAKNHCRANPPQKLKTMKKNIIIAAIAAFAAFAANTQVVNAQELSTVEKSIIETCKAIKVSQEKMGIANRASDYYDVEKLNIQFTEEEIYSLYNTIRKNATSGWGIGLEGGCIQMAENFSPTFGIEATYAGKYILAGFGFEGAISKLNAESSNPGKSFFAPIASAKLGIILARLALGGYDNMAYIACGYEFKYILDKNKNLSGEYSYETPTEIVTNRDYFYVEGNSMCHTVFLEGRFSLKHMSNLSLGVKLYAGAYNRYYMEGSRRKAMVGGSVSLYFGISKKHTDKNVELLKTQLEELNNRIDQTR